ncbi:MAG: hypothetical protein IJY62_05005 [Clostridia bacterium]|nr:hypothetical protein [Clostridia bacterium]
MKKKIFTLRIDATLHSKFNYIAHEDQRNMTNALIKLMYSHVKNYEEKYGEIDDEDIYYFLKRK